MLQLWIMNKFVILQHCRAKPHYIYHIHITLVYTIRHFDWVRDGDGQDYNYVCKEVLFYSIRCVYCSIFVINSLSLCALIRLSLRCCPLPYPLTRRKHGDKLCDQLTVQRYPLCRFLLAEKLWIHLVPTTSSFPSGLH